MGSHPTGGSFFFYNGYLGFRTVLSPKCLKVGIIMYKQAVLLSCHGAGFKLMIPSKMTVRDMPAHRDM